MTGGQHLVRPRWVWSGLVTALVGAAVLSVGLMMLAVLPSVLGTVLLLLGAAVSLRGGVMYDAVPELGVRRELRQVRDGTVHPGVAAGDMVASDRARRDAIASNQRTRALQRAAHHPDGVAWAPVAGWTCLLLTTALVVSQWNLVAHDATGADNSFRDTGCAILLGIAGIRVAAAAGPHPVAAAVMLLAGLALVLGGVLADHEGVGLAIVEIGCGVLALCCALAAYLSPVLPGQAESSS